MTSHSSSSTVEDLSSCVPKQLLLLKFLICIEELDPQLSKFLLVTYQMVKDFILATYKFSKKKNNNNNICCLGQFTYTLTSFGRPTNLTIYLQRPYLKPQQISVWTSPKVVKILNLRLQRRKQISKSQVAKNLGV